MAAVPVVSLEDPVTGSFVLGTTVSVDATTDESRYLGTQVSFRSPQAGIVKPVRLDVDQSTRERVSYRQFRG